jgi:hypothetical protein
LGFRLGAITRGHGDLSAARLAFQFRRCLAILAILAISCGPLPMSLSHGPHPPGTLVENKGQTQIRPSGDRSVDAFFLRFSWLQLQSISAAFFVFYCSLGRGLQVFKAARRKTGVPDELGFWLGGVEFRRASNRHPERAVQPGVKDPNWRSPPSLPCSTRP